jgi:hypothetical protein
MDHILETDKRFQILHRPGWSIGDTAVASSEGICWLVYGTSGDHSIQSNGKTQEEAWKQACQPAEEMGLVQPVC